MIFSVLNCVLGCPICCSTPQINTWTSDWVEFFAEHRLGYQLKLALEQFGDSSIYEKGNLVLVIGVHQLNIILCFMKDASWQLLMHEFLLDKSTIPNVMYVETLMTD